MKKFKRVLLEASGCEVPGTIAVIFIVLGFVSSVSKDFMLGDGATFAERLSTYTDSLFGLVYAFLLLVSVALCLLSENHRRMRLHDMDSAGRVFHPIGWLDLCPLVIVSMVASYVVGLWLEPLHAIVSLPICCGGLWCGGFLWLVVGLTWFDGILPWYEEKKRRKWGG